MLASPQATSYGLSFLADHIMTVGRQAISLGCATSLKDRDRRPPAVVDWRLATGDRRQTVVFGQGREWRRAGGMWFVACLAWWRPQ